MRAIGIDVEGKNIMFYILENRNLENARPVYEYLKPFELDNDRDVNEVRELYCRLHNFIDDEEYTSEMGILSRPVEGEGSRVALKIEAIMQIHESKSLQVISPETMAEFFKDRSLPFKTKYPFQENAAKLAYYLLKRKKDEDENEEPDNSDEA